MGPRRVGDRAAPDDTSFRRRQNLRGNPTTQARIAYRGPNPQSNLPKVKIDITSDEVFIGRPELRAIGHQYSDTPLPTQVRCYPLTELFGEKLRALAERCRPRDLYDVVHTHRHPDVIGSARVVAGGLEKKCEHAGIEVPTLESISASPYRDEVEREWANMLGHQLPKPLPPFADFWSTLEDVFAWLAGTSLGPSLQRAAIGDLDPTWVPPKAITSWRMGVPLELLRYAGANRLRVEVDYRAERGRQGPRAFGRPPRHPSRDTSLSSKCARKDWTAESGNRSEAFGFPLTPYFRRVDRVPRRRTGKSEHST